MTEIAIIGYSGHGYVAIEIFGSLGKRVVAYCDMEEKLNNPYQLKYLGSEKELLTKRKLKQFEYFISIGDNLVRRSIYEDLVRLIQTPVNAIHSSAIISQKTQIGKGVMIGTRAVIHPLVIIGNGVICNTGSIIEHECLIGDFCHIAPAAVLCGKVEVGEGSFIGANSVVKEGIKIGSNVIVGAGSVIISDIPDNAKVVGNPHRFL